MSENFAKSGIEQRPVSASTLIRRVRLFIVQVFKTVDPVRLGETIKEFAA